MDDVHGQPRPHRVRDGRDLDHPCQRPRAHARWDVTGSATISDQATLANGFLYWGSWDGYEHATDASTGEELWRTFLGEETDNNCAPPHVGVGSTAAIGSVQLHGRPNELLFVGGGDGSVYALRASTGAIVWSRNFGSPKQGWFIWSSPALYRGSVYIGVASIGSCPLVRGALVKLDAATGATQAEFDTVAKGCIGASVWSSPTIDASTGTLYATTGNQGGACTNREPYAQAMLQFSATTSGWRGHGGAQAQLAPDSDFGGDTDPLYRPDRRKVDQARRRREQERHLRRVPPRRHRRRPRLDHSTLPTYPVTVASSAWDGHHLYVAGMQTTDRRGIVTAHHPRPLHRPAGSSGRRAKGR